MNILFTIPHYFRPLGGKALDGREHGSVALTAQPRIAALTECISAVHLRLGSGRCVLDHAGKRARRIEPNKSDHIDVVVCTAGNHHLLDQIDLPSGWLEHRPTSAEPLLLGYACHAVLRERLGRYDYYCYLEDDIILTDPWLFRKLTWFNRRFGAGKLLQPNRFESGPHPLVRKVYVDGELAARCTALYQDMSVEPELAETLLGERVVFRRTLNPHSGCFFLSASQMEQWSRQPYFLDHATSFIGPLESAASLGIMRTFQVYKPALENGDFLEIRHHGTAYLDMIRG
jgi:hypothetical protein